jgi:integrase
MATLRKLKNGHWEVVIELGRDPETKKRLTQSKTFAKHGDAKAHVAKIEGQKAEGKYTPTLPNKITLAEYLRRWLKTAKFRNPYNVETVLGKWVLNSPKGMPLLGSVKLRELTYDHFERFYIAMAEDMAKRGRLRTGRGISYVHGLLKRALDAATVKGELTSNPAKAAELPKEVKGTTPVRYLTAEQEQRFLRAARKDRLAAYWLLLLDTGLRPGESHALKWEADPADEKVSWIDLDAQLVHVNGTLSRVGGKKQHGAQGWKVDVPKTPNSKRVVPICDDTVDELRRWKKAQIAERLKVGPRWQNHGFAFTTEVGTPLGAVLVGRWWARVLREANGGKGDLGTLGPAPEKKKGPRGAEPEPTFRPRFSVYVLRHTMSTLNFLDGMDLGLLSRRLGHSSLAFTFDTYGRGVSAQHTKAVAENTQKRWRAGAGA